MKLAACFLFVSVSLWSISPVARAQNPTWVNYTCGDDIIDVEGNGNFVWIATSGGLVQYDKQTGMSTFFNKANSGLLHNEIISLAVEPSGNLWVITAAGLSRFDGSNWVLFTSANSGLPTDNLYDVATDGNGDEWIATSAGLVSYDGTNWAVYDTATSDISSNYTLRVFISPSGEKWMSTLNGIERFDGSTWTLYDYSAIGFPGELTRDIAFIDNQVWVAAESWYGAGVGLINFDGNNWTAFTPANSALPFYSVDCVEADSSGNLWIGNRESFGINNALVKFDGVNWLTYPTGASIANNYLNHLFIDANNNLFAGTQGTGIFQFDGNSFSKISSSNSGLNMYGGSRIYIDSHQQYWIPNNHGFTHFDGESWEVFDSTNSIYLYSGIFAIAHDLSENTWIGTFDGLVKYDGTDWTRFDVSNSGLGTNYINSLAIDENNVVWIGTYLLPYSFDGITWTDYYTDVGSYINDVFVSDDGNVWMASASYGLSRFDLDTTWQHYVCFNGGSCNAGALDHNGNVWYGSSNGVHKWDDASCTDFTTADGLPWTYVVSLAIDKNNILWIGTQNGLSKYDGTSFTNYLEANSALTNNYIMDIEVDANNNKWIATSNGISVYNENGVVLGTEQPEMNIHEHLTMFPNPANEILRIQRAYPSRNNSRMIITDVWGKEVVSSTIESESISLDVSSFNAGLYLCRIIGNSGYIETGKFVVAR